MLPLSAPMEVEPGVTIQYKRDKQAARALSLAQTEPARPSMCCCCAAPPIAASQ